MKNYTFARWCQEAVSQIKYTPDRDEVYDELRAHLEDHRDALMEQGYSREDAERLAIEAMGSAKELAPQLAAVHKPFWGYVYSVMRRIAAVLAAFSFFFLIMLIVGSIDRHNLEETIDYEKTDYFSDTSFQSEFYSGERLALADLNGTAECGSYTIQLQQAALWEVTGFSTTETDFYIKMNISTPWNRGYIPSFQYFIWAEDSLGTVYNPARFDVRISCHTDWESYTSVSYVMQFQNISTDAQWIDLHYDRGGRTMRLRIMLPGGVTS